MYEAKILRHSISEKGVELVTFEVNYPHSVHKDVMTHRWARNFQSFRAVPPEILLEKILRGEYFRPERLSKRTKGMGRGNALEVEREQANAIWDDHVMSCVSRAQAFLEMDIAKEQINFFLQDLCFIRGIITTTMPQLKNFFGLRLARDEQGDPRARLEVYKIAEMMFDAFEVSEPQTVGHGAWHLPLVTDEEIIATIPSPMTLDNPSWAPDWEFWRKVSVGRCARVSYLTHDGIRDPEADVALHDRLLYDGHMSPFEHQGSPIDGPIWRTTAMQANTGSFGYGWTQYRKLIPGESNYDDLKGLAGG